MDHKQSRNQTERKDHKTFEGRRITQQLPCQIQAPKSRLKYDPQSKQCSEIDTFRTLLSKRDRHKESQSKLEHRPTKRYAEEMREEKVHTKKEHSKSRSKSKGLSKSKSLKQLGKKSKSMTRLEPKRDRHREQRKSQSPQYHAKSTISYERKHIVQKVPKSKSNYNSKTHRDFVSEITTERQKSKSKPKIAKQIKKNTLNDTKNGTQKVFKKKKAEKENVKYESKTKNPKIKKQKRVLISEQHSKIRRQCEQWELTLNEDEFLDPRHRENKSKNGKKNSNIVDIPKRKQRLSFNPNLPRKPSLKNKTQVELQSYRSQKRQLQNFAATKIQKVWRGYLTRKYIRESFQHNAAIKIQKVWRGYSARKSYQKRKERQLLSNLSPLELMADTHRILEQEDYLLMKEDSKSIIRNSGLNERWTSILEEILSQQSVNENIKKKIGVFLEWQQKSLHEFEVLQQNKSPRSSISSQVIHNEIASQRHFIEKQRRKNTKQSDNHGYLSPKTDLEKRKMYSSPQIKDFCSPQNRLSSFSPARSSTQLLINNLKSIQKMHRDRLEMKANDQKEQLNKMLIKNTMSPRTHEKKYKQVDMFLESELQRFNESINEVVKNCMLYGEQQPEDIPDSVMTTPKKQLTQLNMPPPAADISPTHNPLRGQQMSLQFRQYYQNQQATGNQLQLFEPFDTSYQFIEEYLISLIDFMRQNESGAMVGRLLDIIQKPISLDIKLIMENLNLMTQNSYQGEEEEQNDNSFRMPKYKYLEMQQQIIEDQVLQDFNSIFPKAQPNELKIPSALQDTFLKMISDCMNEALNGLRPRVYPFAEVNLSALNFLKGLDKLPFEGEGTEQQINYQYVCAQALNQIFYWNKHEWGKVIRYAGEADEEMRHFLLREQQKSIGVDFMQEKWVYYEELIEILGLLAVEVLNSLVLEQIASVWEVFLEWQQKTRRSPVKIQAPNSRDFFLA